MSAGPARVAGVTGKGAIDQGQDADLVAFAPDEAFTVDPARLYHRHKLTPYAGQRLTGVVRRAWLRGRPLAPTSLSAVPASLLARGPRPAAEASAL